MIKIKKNVSATAHNEYIGLCNAMNNDIQEPRLRRRQSWGTHIDTGTFIKLVLPVTKILRELTGIEHTSIACYINSCIAFYGVEYADLSQCPFCNEPRFNQRKRPQKTFDYIPIIHQLRLQFANPERARELQEYRRKLENVESSEGIRDYWDGRLHREHKEQGLFDLIAWLITYRFIPGFPRYCICIQYGWCTAIQNWQV